MYYSSTATQGNELLIKFCEVDYGDWDVSLSVRDCRCLHRDLGVHGASRVLATVVRATHAFLKAYYDDYNKYPYYLNFRSIGSTTHTNAIAHRMVTRLARKYGYKTVLSNIYGDCTIRLFLP